MRYAVVIEKAGSNYSAYVPDLPGCVATGETVAAVEMEVRDAIRFHIEGLEADVLAGLTRPVAALSFEFTTIQREVALACLARCAALGYVRFNAALGEQQQFAFEDWRSREEIAAWLRALPPSANSGDIYAAMG